MIQSAGIPPNRTAVATRIACSRKTRHLPCDRHPPKLPARRHGRCLLRAASVHPHDEPFTAGRDASMSWPCALSTGPPTSRLNPPTCSHCRDCETARQEITMNTGVPLPNTPLMINSPPRGWISALTRGRPGPRFLSSLDKVESIYQNGADAQIIASLTNSQSDQY